MAASITLDSVKVEQVEATEGTTALALGGITVGGQAAGLKGELALTVDGVELTLGLSKLEGEEGWTVDAMTANGHVSYANGYGARYLRTKQLTDAELIAELDARAAALAGEDVRCDCGAPVDAEHGCLGGCGGAS